ncbi:MAG: histidinol-phosphatase HisJ family protein [Spirochaetaceae bacterium]|nr:MAG: histidinol-phosphatase HisJ family protein [Spirochaetaceae bacterium]
MCAIIDLHTHHERCGHATGTLRDYIEVAIRKGFRAIGLSDHAPLFAHRHEHPAPEIQMGKHEFENYLSEAVELKQIYSDRIEVLVGAECDYLPGTEAIYQQALQDERLDYVLGSVHEFSGYHVFKPSTWQHVQDPEEVYSLYYSAVRCAAESGLFDVVAHIDAIRAMGPATDCDILPYIEDAVDAIARNGIAVEINTSGIRKCGESFPAASLVKMLHSMCVPFTYGSDSHHPEEVGYGWEEVSRVLLGLGVHRLLKFDKRRPVEVEIPSA